MREGLTPGVLDIQPHELVSRLLQATGQDTPGAVDPAALLAFLKLDFLPVDFKSSLAPVLPLRNGKVRALLSFPDRLVAVDMGLDERRIRFSALHEVGHYVLPAHQHALYLCDAEGLGAGARLDFEIEANHFAAELLFKGAHFSLEANGEPVSARTVKTLATRYNASFEATARRLVERHHGQVMFVVFGRVADESLIGPSGGALWKAQYCIASHTFRARRFRRVDGVAPVEITSALTEGYRDLADGIVANIRVGESEFRSEWFTNQYNVMAFLMPLG